MTSLVSFSPPRQIRIGLLMMQACLIALIFPSTVALAPPTRLSSVTKAKPNNFLQMVASEIGPRISNESSSKNVELKSVWYRNTRLAETAVQVSQRVTPRITSRNIALLAFMLLLLLPAVLSKLLSFSGLFRMIPTMTLSRSGVFYEALSLVFLSELGDKTFFMAGLLAMKTSRWVSFLGSFGALAAMTAISVFIGQLFHAAPLTAVSIPLDKYAAVLAFAFFGFKTIMEAGGGHSNSVSRGNNDVENEQQEAAKTINGTLQNKPVWAQITSAFALVFCAEFGDRSMLATIALGATHNPFRVALGAIAGHGLTTLIAVCGGSYFAKHISEEAVGYFSGALFLLLSLTTALNIF